VRRLRDLGWIEHRNVAIEYRWANGRPSAGIIPHIPVWDKPAGRRHILAVRVQVRQAQRLHLSGRRDGHDQWPGPQRPGDPLLGFHGSSCDISPTFLAKSSSSRRSSIDCVGKARSSSAVAAEGK
jgi:hypothetical protein